MIKVPITYLFLGDCQKDSIYRIAEEQEEYSRRDSSKDDKG